MSSVLAGAPPVERLTEISQPIRAHASWAPDKADLYAVDQYFREACWTFGEDIATMQSIAMCMLKAEATAGRRLRPALQALRESGFRPVDVVRFRHDRLTIREVWRYQFNIATRERVEAMDLILPSIDTVCLVLRDERWSPGGIPAAVRLNSLKGPADAHLRTPEHLRYRLGVVNGLFNFVHISDELGDVLREIAVVCDEPRRELMLGRVRADQDVTPAVIEIFDDLEQRHPEHDFDFEESWRRLASVPGPVGDPARRRAADGEPTLAELLAVTQQVALDHPSRWDLLTVVTHLLVNMNVPGVTPAVPTVTDAWPGCQLVATGPTQRGERPGQGRPVELIIFDCDGVLVDSEPIAVRLHVQLGAELGWPMTEAQVLRHFVGRSTTTIRAEIARRLDPETARVWYERFEVLQMQAAEAELATVRGVEAALDRLVARGFGPQRWCVASSGSHRKVRYSLERVGLYERFAGRVFSAQDVENGKPAPDLFLHAASQMGVEPAACVVVEDSQAGVRAARAAKMRVLGYAGGLTPTAWLTGPQTVVFTDMQQLPDLVLGLAASGRPAGANPRARRSTVDEMTDVERE